MTLARTILVGCLLPLLLPLVPAADATVQWFTSLDACNTPTLDSTGATGLWASITGTPTLVTTGLDGDPGNLCAYGIAPTSGQNVYLAKSFTSDASLFAGMHVKFASCPTTRRRILTFRSTNEPKFGAMVTVERASGSTTQCLLRAFYESSDVAPGECSASASMDQTECGGACTGSDTSTCVLFGTAQRNDIACSSSRCVNECDAANTDIGSQCLPGIYAQTLSVGLNTWYSVSLGQVNGSGATAGSVTVSLSQGLVAGAAAVQRGSSTRKQGKCTGGTGATHKNGLACNIDADCPGGGTPTCSIADVVNIEEVRFGTDDSVAGGFSYTIDALWTDNASVLQNWRVESLRPIGQDGLTDADTAWESVGSAHSCGSGAEWQCLNDGTSPDDATSALDHSVSARPTFAVQFATPVPTNPVPTPLAAAVAILGQDTSNTGASTLDLEWFETGAYATKKTAVFTPFDLEDNPGTGGSSDAYYTLPSLVSVLAPDGTGWDATDLANMRLTLNKTAGSGNSGRVTNTIASVLSLLPDPPVPTIIPDRNLNGIRTVVWVGDSKMNQQTLKITATGGLLEPDNLIECAEDGGRIGDIVRDISIAGPANDLVETAPLLTSGWTCTALKGATGDTADVILVEAFANTSILPNNLAAPALDTAHEGAALGMGWCDDNGGANQGGKCSCPIHSDPTSRPFFPLIRYCRVRGTFWKSTDWTNCFCNTNADCKTDPAHSSGVCAPIATPTAPAATRTPGNPTPKTCAVTTPSLANSAVTDDPPNAWNLPGCLNAPGCTNGLCLSVPNENYLQDSRLAIVSAIAARATPTTYMTATPPTPTPAKTPRPPIAILVAPQPPLMGMVESGSAFPSAEQMVGAARAKMIATAEARGLPWIDLAARFLRDCPGRGLGGFDKDPITFGANTDGLYNGENYCLKDSVHASDYGDVIQAQAVIDCLTNAQGTSDGICGPTPTPPLATPGTRRCTQGKVNDNCTDDPSCSTYHCALGLVP